MATNSKLKGEFRFNTLFGVLITTTLSSVLRMALDIVEGYVIDTSKPWCAPYARWVGRAVTLSEYLRVIFTSSSLLITTE